jgi:hypothetical protein
LHAATPSAHTQLPLELQVWPALLHVPQFIVPTHASDTEPQTRLPQEAVAVHPHTPGTPLPPHVLGGEQLFPHEPQLELSVLKLVQPPLHAFGLELGQTQLPAPEQIWPVPHGVSFTQ